MADHFRSDQRRLTVGVPTSNVKVGNLFASGASNDPAFGIGYQNLTFTRNTNLNPAGPAAGGAAGFVTTAAGNMDFTNLTSEGGVAQINYTFSDKFVLKFGLSATNIRGHYDPAGIFNNFAFDTGTNNFNNIKA